MLYNALHEFMESMLPNLNPNEVLEFQTMIYQEAKARGLVYTPEEIQMAKTNKIGAIKSLRSRVDIGLKEAKDLVDRLWEVLEVLK